MMPVITRKGTQQQASAAPAPASAAPAPASPAPAASAAPAPAPASPASAPAPAAPASASAAPAPVQMILTSKKCIDFYNKNPHIDFNSVNEMYIDLFQKFASSNGNIFKVDEMKSALTTLDKKISMLENNITQNNTMIKMTHDSLNNNKEFYSQQIKSILNEKDNDPVILQLVREANETWTQKSIMSIQDMIPKINGTISTEIVGMLNTQQEKTIRETNETFRNYLENEKQFNSQDALEKVIKENYDNISNKLLATFQPFFNQESTFYQNNVELRSFLDRQNNSSSKGKISEEKLENTLNKVFPSGSITNKSGEAKSCDYILERNEKQPILFENKDYANNVPNEEVKKFIRDIEHQKHDGILLSQHSGVSNKDNYQMDIHDGLIMVFVHMVQYDESKIRVAVNIVDHLRNLLNKYTNKKEELKFTKDDISAINKEYLNFVEQRNALIESYKKSYKEHLKQLENFEMPLLTKMLDSIFTNVEQLSYTCQYCNVFHAKNKRALTTHQNKCKKIIQEANTETNDHSIMKN